MPPDYRTGTAMVRESHTSVQIAPQPCRTSLSAACGSPLSAYIDANPALSKIPHAIDC